MTKKTFTLLELVIVLLIIGALTTMAIGQYLDSQKLSKRSIFESNINEIAKALSLYRSNKVLLGTNTVLYPTSLSDPQFKMLFEQEPKNPYTSKPMLTDNSADSGIQYVSDGTSYKLCVVQRDVDDVNNNGVVEEVLPLSTKTACIGNTQTSVRVTFTRNSVAYTSNGAQVGANVPRFEAGKFGQGILIEEKTTNLVTNPGFENGTIDGWFHVYGGPAPDYNYAVTTEDSWEGNYCVKLWTSPNATKDSAIATERIPVDITKTYAFSVYVKGDVQELTVQCFDSNNVFIGNIHFPLHYSGYHPNWVRDTVIVGPSKFIPGTAKIRIKRGVSGPSKVGYVDAAQIEEKPYATSFIDGTRAAETLTIPTASVLNPQEGTVEFWVKPLVVTNWNNFFYMDTSNGRFLLFFTTNGTAKFDYGPNNTGPQTPAGTIEANNWYHIVLRWSATTGKQALFVNGVKYEQNLPNGVASSFPSTVSIVNNYSAYIDDLRISSRARTDEEIAAAYQSNQPLPVDAWTTLKLDFNGDLSTQSGVIP